jgi:hypothetical protein
VKRERYSERSIEFEYGDDGAVAVFEFVGYGHASIVPRPGVAKRGKLYASLFDDPCDCDDEHVELWAVRS